MRKEMRAIFQEVLASLKENGSNQGYLIDEGRNALKIMGKLDKNSLDCVKPLFAKHNLGVKEEEGCTIIYSL